MKKNLLLLALAGLFLAGCHKYDDTDGDWVRVAEFAGANRYGAVTFTDPESGEVFVGLGFNSTSSYADQNQRDFWKFNGSGWERVGALKEIPAVEEGADPDTIHSGDFPALGRRNSVAFVIDRKAYVGGGYRGSFKGHAEEEYFSDFYVFDLDKEEWIRDEKGVAERHDIAEDTKNRPEDCAFFGGVAFSFGGKGYVGTGKLKDRYTKEFYVFDPAVNKWATQTGYPGDACEGAVVMNFDNKQIVVCLGVGSSGLVRTVSVFDGEWKQGTPLNEDLPGDWNEDYDEVLRSYAIAFMSDKDPAKNRTIGYVVGGTGGTVSDNWQYDIVRDRWEKTNKFSKNMSTRVGGVGFTYNGYGYITTGGSGTNIANDNTTWKFYPGIEAEDWNDWGGAGN